MSAPRDRYSLGIRITVKKPGQADVVLAVPDRHCPFDVLAKVRDLLMPGVQIEDDWEWWAARRAAGELTSDSAISTAAAARAAQAAEVRDAEKREAAIAPAETVSAPPAPPSVPAPVAKTVERKRERKGGEPPPAKDPRKEIPDEIPDVGIPAEEMARLLATWSNDRLTAQQKTVVCALISARKPLAIERLAAESGLIVPVAEQRVGELLAAGEIVAIDENGVRSYERRT